MLLTPESSQVQFRESTVLFEPFRRLRKKFKILRFHTFLTLTLWTKNFQN